MRRLSALVVSLLLVVVAPAPPASSAESPRPRARLLSSGVMTTPDGDEESYIKVKARDVDGIISEIEILWGDGSISYAHSYPCLFEPRPAPGDPHRFIVSNDYQEPGEYKVRYVVHSMSGCSENATYQHSKVYKVWLTAP